MDKLNVIHILIDPYILFMIFDFVLVFGSLLIIILPIFIYDDHYKIYLVIQKGIAILFMSSTIIIIGNTDIGVVNNFWSYNPEITLKYMTNIMPLIFFYPIAHSINKRNYQKGIYYRLVERRKEL